MLFKLDLGVNGTQKDDYYTLILESNQKELLTRGVHLDLSSIDDTILLVDYTIWNYRNRNEDATLPNHIRLRLMNRKVERRIIRDD